MDCCSKWFCSWSGAAVGSQVLQVMWWMSCSCCTSGKGSSSSTSQGPSDTQLVTQAQGSKWCGQGCETQQWMSRLGVQNRLLQPLQLLEVIKEWLSCADTEQWLSLSRTFPPVITQETWQSNLSFLNKGRRMFLRCLFLNWDKNFISKSYGRVSCSYSSGGVEELGTASAAQLLPLIT